MVLPDHRKIGRQLGIFASSDVCGPGLPLWLPAGTAVRDELERFVVELEREAGYEHVHTPMLAKRALYERSGHWVHYRADMWPPMDMNGEQVVLRPMLCPHHILIYESEARSARRLPVRIAEVGAMFRRERSGSVGGLSRVRQMTLNDGHVFAAPDQVGEEVASILGLIGRAYRTLRLPKPRLRLSLHGESDKYAAAPGIWLRSEAALRGVLDELGMDYEQAPGEAAFYGPKIDIQVRDPLGREQTLSTVQLDFHLPERFGLKYRSGTGEAVPVMVHRSIVSTMERMVAHLLEVHAGALPFWISPVQVLVLPATGDALAYAVEVHAALGKVGIRAELDSRDETLGARVRDARHKHFPCMVVVGEREMTNRSVSVRGPGGRQHEELALGPFVDKLREASRLRAPDVAVAGHPS